MAVLNGNGGREPSWKHQVSYADALPVEHSVTHFNPQDKRSWEWAKWVAVGILAVFVSGMMVAEQISSLASKTYVKEAIESNNTRLERMEKAVEATNHMMLVIGRNQANSDEKLTRVIESLEAAGRVPVGTSRNTPRSDFDTTAREILGQDTVRQFDRAQSP